ncbi:MAG: glycosyltransferase family 2 protein [Syntrophobacteraceae bacterium]|jgi:glycosyltransferase involved in cell wall biosynthesis|nr:glycosyltransferase family 2 protein [Syntrophobacteraceae bacterium]
MVEVSAAIITRNEARNIGRCLDSLGWVSEVVVLDQFSTDGTAEMAASRGARVFQEAWQGFAAQKNLAVHRTTGSWVLSIDADERVTDPLRLEIEGILDRDGPLDGYFIPRRNYFCERWIRHGGWYPDYSLRLFRRGRGRFEERAVHEKVVVRGKTGYLNHPLEHFTYVSVSDYLQRMDRYSELASREMVREGRCARWHDLTLRPLFTFLKMYGLKLGFLDGRAGFFLAISYAYYTFLKYYRLESDPA